MIEIDNKQLSNNFINACPAIYCKIIMNKIELKYTERIKVNAKIYTQYLKSNSKRYSYQPQNKMDAYDVPKVDKMLNNLDDFRAKIKEGKQEWKFIQEIVDANNWISLNSVLGMAILYLSECVSEESMVNFWYHYLELLRSMWPTNQSIAAAQYLMPITSSMLEIQQQFSYSLICFHQYRLLTNKAYLAEVRNKGPYIVCAYN